MQVPRSSVYYEKKGKGEKEENIELMQLIGEKYSKLGHRRMRAILKKETGKAINKDELGS